MATDALTSQLLGQEDQWTPPTPDYTGGGADEGEPEDTGDTENQARLAALKEQRKLLMDSISSVYGGQDTQKSWKGTPAIGLSAFQGHRQDRQPAFNSRGQRRGYRSAPGAPSATPPEGLIGGKALENDSHLVDVSNPFNASLTPESDWRAMFKTKPTGVQLIGKYGKNPVGGTPFRQDSFGNSSTVTSQYGTGSASVRPNSFGVFASPFPQPNPSIYAH